MIDRGDSILYKTNTGIQHSITVNIDDSPFAWDYAGLKRVRGMGIDLGAFEAKTVILRLDSVYITAPVASDTIVCSGSTVSLVGSYKNPDIIPLPNAASISLEYWWEYTPDTARTAPTRRSSAPHGDFTGGELLPANCTYNINPIQPADSGYYRLVVENNSGYGQNFQIASRYVHLTVYKHSPTPDIRLFVRPTQGMTVNMSAYIDTLAYPAGTTIKWIAPTGMPRFVAGTETTTGTLDVSAWSRAKQLYIYKYELDACGLSPGKAYVQTVDRYNRTDSVEICSDISPVINLSRLFGVEDAGNVAGNAWSAGADPDMAIANNMHLITTGKHAGAMTFNVQAALAAATNTVYNHPQINSRPTKRFEIKYASGTIIKTVWLVVY